MVEGGKIDWAGHNNIIELDDCTIQNSYFRGTKIENCDLTGMTIDGVLVTDMVENYKKTKPKA